MTNNVINYLQTEIQKCDVVLSRFNNEVSDRGLMLAIPDSLKSAYQADYLRSVLAMWVSKLQSETYSIEDIVGMFKGIDDTYTTLRLTQSPIPSSTNLMYNITHLWEFESYPRILNIIKGVHRILNKKI